MKALLLAAGFAMIGSAGHAADIAATLPEVYRGAWADSNPVPISRALAAHKAKDCGSYSWKQAPDKSSIVVYCTVDYEHWHRWSRYMVDADTGRVDGPLKPWPGVKPPTR